MSNNLTTTMKQADNVYRTRHFIVCQFLAIEKDQDSNVSVVSFDVYFLRTAKRDLEYLCSFGNRCNLDGKRLSSTMYSRTYKA